MAEIREWSTDLVEKLILGDPVLMEASEDLLIKNSGPLAAFWLSKFIWDATHGAGIPGTDMTQARRVAETVNARYFPHVDFEQVRLTILTQQQG
jgi:hypothetical protein